VLERSVDIEGADFFIQRRITTNSLLDREPPRLGLVQAKFFKDASTPQYVRIEYVLDRDLIPRPEFFLICHSGNEDAARSYLLTSSEIAENFKQTPEGHSRPGHYYLPGSSLLIQRFEIIDRSRSLDKIEAALRSADFRANRSFLSWAMPSLSGDHPPIQHKYTEPIDNWWGDIPSAFDELRIAAARAQYNLQDVLALLQEMETCDDPQKALAIAEELRDEWGGTVSFPINDLFNEDFQGAVIHHRRRYEELETAGLLGAHSTLRRQAGNHIVAEIAPKMPMDRDNVHITSVRYDADTLLDPRFESRIELAATLWGNRPEEPEIGRQMNIPTSHGVLKSAPGNIEVYVTPGRFSYQQYRRGEWVDTSGSWRDRISTVVDLTARLICEEVLRLRFSD